MRPDALVWEQQVTASVTTAAYGSATELAFGSPDRTVAIIDYARTDTIREDPAARACERAGGALDAQAWAAIAPRMPYVDTCTHLPSPG
jgi:hypothetical protein